MKISEHIKHSLDASVGRDLEKAMLFSCLAVDGTAKKAYPSLKVGERFKNFINDNIDIIQFIFGGIDLKETIFPFKDSKGIIGIRFADIVYEKYRCSLAHGDELPDGFGVSMKVVKGLEKFSIDIENQSMTLPESAIHALGLVCVLAPVNADQKIGDDTYLIMT